MKNQFDLACMADTIGLLRKKTEELQKMGKGLPAVKKNTARILASVKMLELNIADAVELLTELE